MKTINVNLGQNTYPVYMGNGILDQFAQVLSKHSSAWQIVIISVKEIFDLYGETLLSGFENNKQVQVLLIPDGEKAKSLQQVEALYTKLLQKKFERGVVIVALGGGVVGDLSGFVASTYLRGVDFVQVPTTLLAQVDSSIGGKTGVNHPLGKNLIGAFKQPLFVLADTQTLQSLPDVEIRCGLGEVIKYGFILNRIFFEYLKENTVKALQKDAEVLLHLVETSAREKAKIVEQDEKESNLRMILNFGHTFGHALEAEFNYEGLKHGEAVLLGMQCALLYAREAGRMETEEFDLGMELLQRVPVSIERSALNAEALFEHMTRDKKVRDKNIHLILVEKMGKYKIEQKADSELIKKTWQRFIEMNRFDSGYQQDAQNT